MEVNIMKFGTVATLRGTNFFRLDSSGSDLKMAINEKVCLAACLWQ